MNGAKVEELERHGRVLEHMIEHRPAWAETFADEISTEIGALWDQHRELLDILKDMNGRYIDAINRYSEVLLKLATAVAKVAPQAFAEQFPDPAKKAAVPTPGAVSTRERKAPRKAKRSGKTT